jgi:pilus assembly protein FimV
LKPKARHRRRSRRTCPRSQPNAQLTPAEPVVAPAPAAVDTAPPATPATSEAPAAQEQGALDQLLGNPLLLGLIAGSAFLALLLLLLLLARKRKAQQEAEKHLRMARALSEEGDRAPDLDLPPDSFDGLDVSAPSVTLSPAVVAASAAAATAAEMPAPAPAPAAPAVDPRAALFAEVDESLARGRLNHAADLLEAAVASEPQRSDLRLKLMEVYARQGDQDAFAGQERKLAPGEQNQAEVASLKERFPAMLGVAAVAAVPRPWLPSWTNNTSRTCCRTRRRLPSKPSLSRQWSPRPLPRPS